MIVGTPPAEANGGPTSIERLIPPRCGRNGLHLHLDFEQTFTVREGRCRVTLDGADHVLEAGDALHVPLRAVHTDPINDFDEPVLVENAVTPHLRFHDAYSATLGLLHQTSRLDDQAEFPKLALMAVLHDSGARSYVPKVPIAVQRVAIPAMAALGRLRGYRVVYDMPAEPEPVPAPSA